MNLRSRLWTGTGWLSTALAKIIAPGGTGDIWVRGQRTGLEIYSLLSERYPRYYPPREPDYPQKSVSYPQISGLDVQRNVAIALAPGIQRLLHFIQIAVQDDHALINLLQISERGQAALLADLLKF